MPDGVKLATDVYVPRGDGPWATVLLRTPYGKARGGMHLPILAKMLARHGYAVVIQDVRGRFDSEGVWEPFANEQEDGVTTMGWLTNQSWCNGRIGMLGASYFGFTQWAAGIHDPPGLDTMVPWIISTDIYHWFYTGGAFRPELASTWAASVSDPRKNLHGTREEEDILFLHLPAREADDAWKQDLPYYDEWVDHDVPGAPYTTWLPLDAPARVKVPMMLVAGWFDIFGPEQIRDWQALLSRMSFSVKTRRIALKPAFCDFDKGKTECVTCEQFARVWFLALVGWR